jgi:hypothetical protein
MPLPAAFTQQNSAFFSVNVIMSAIFIWRLAENILHKQPRTNDKGWSSSLGVGRGANTPHRKKHACYEKYQ